MALGAPSAYPHPGHHELPAGWPQPPGAEVIPHHAYPCSLGPAVDVDEGQETDPELNR